MAVNEATLSMYSSLVLWLSAMPLCTTAHWIHAGTEDENGVN